MNLYKTTLTPHSSFATPLKGDTIFGHICWMISYLWGDEKLKELLANYKKGKPFLVVSDGFVKGYLPKPKMPSYFLNEDSNCKKENRRKIWLTFKDLLEANYKNAKKESDILEKREKIAIVIKNSLHYEQFTTTKGSFAPYANKEYFFTQKDLYFLLDEKQLSKKEFEEVLKLFALHGYGKDITTGKGRFVIDDIEKVEIDFQAKTFMSLSPFALTNQEEIEQVYYEPFVRFGKFGGKWAYYNAFKKPILFLDTASVVVFKEKRKRYYVGKAIDNISLSDDLLQQESVQQGYTILFPLKDLQCKE